MEPGPPPQLSSSSVAAQIRARAALHPTTLRGHGPWPSRKQGPEQTGQPALREEEDGGCVGAGAAGLSLAKGTETQTGSPQPRLTQGRGGPCPRADEWLAGQAEGEGTNSGGVGAPSCCCGRARLGGPLSLGEWRGRGREGGRAAVPWKHGRWVAVSPHTEIS